MMPTRGPDLPRSSVNHAGGHILPAGIPALNMEGIELASLLMSHGEKDSFPMGHLIRL